MFSCLCGALTCSLLWSAGVESSVGFRRHSQLSLVMPEQCFEFSDFLIGTECPNLVLWNQVRVCKCQTVNTCRCHFPYVFLVSLGYKQGGQGLCASDDCDICRDNNGLVNLSCLWYMLRQLQKQDARGVLPSTESPPSITVKMEETRQISAFQVLDAFSALIIEKNSQFYKHLWDARSLNLFCSMRTIDVLKP